MRQNICHASDNFVCWTDIYGGTWNLFQNTMSTMGIECRFVDPADPENFRKASDAKTRCWYGETLPNPKLAVFLIAEVAKIGRENGYPAHHGQHRLSGTVPADGAWRHHHHALDHQIYRRPRHLDRRRHRRRRQFRLGKARRPVPDARHARPELSRRGMDAGRQAARSIAYIIKARVTLLRDIGAAASPFNCFLHIQGLESVVVRMRQHCANATAVADWLKKQSKVTKVIFPGHMAGELKRRADAYLKGGYGGLVGFELKGGHDAGRKFIDALKMFYHVANIGDARSLAIHPASTTHSQLTPEEQEKTGVTPGYVRLSVGLEHIDDIIADLDQALAVA